MFYDFKKIPPKNFDTLSFLVHRQRQLRCSVSPNSSYTSQTDSQSSFYTHTSTYFKILLQNNLFVALQFYLKHSSKTAYNSKIYILYIFNVRQIFFWKYLDIVSKLQVNSTQRRVQCNIHSKLSQSAGSTRFNLTRKNTLDSWYHDVLVSPHT